ncbi:unnamed protein product [Orchesella dallaii]|uniref:Serine/threonine-protein kinase RIO3 n=1 Tax=Orchesella dallaii TaxID=48710 RepID=A0ABP1PK40_9HEXA
MSCQGGTTVEGPIETPVPLSATNLPPVVPASPPNAVVGGKCPWGQIKSPAAVAEITPVSLRDIMSEQLASSLQIEEEENLVKEILVAEGIEQPAADGFDLTALQSISSPSDDCSSDFLIAQMLQMQYNKEHDHGLKKVEEKFNGASKVSVSLSNYMMNPCSEEEDSSDEEMDSGKKKKAWDKFEAHEKAFPVIPRCGYVKIDNEMVTKHDVTMSGRRNACKVMENFPPCIHTGDGASFDMQLSNKVYNTLKVYSKSEDDRRTRLHEKKEKSTSEMAMDAKTRLMLYKLVNNQILENVYGVISTGKEAVVLYANGGSVPSDTEMLVEIPKECAVKVFKTTLNEFKTRDKYIKDDYRFKDRFSKQNPRKIIHLWAEKEMHNLNRISKAGIPCPQVVLLKKHILILSFIGTDMKPAPMLKEVRFSKDEDDPVLNSAYNQTIDIITRLYKECNLIHGDLSEYNILWHESKCYVIDVSQAVEPSHPHGLEFLYRDCVNIINFFAKKGLKHIHTPESLFTSLCGFDLDGSGAEAVNQIQDYEKDHELLTFAKPEKPFAFDYCWEQSKGGASSPP